MCSVYGTNFTDFHKREVDLVCLKSWEDTVNPSSCKPLQNNMFVFEL